jgi:hypothetical protein
MIRQYPYFEAQSRYDSALDAAIILSVPIFDIYCSYDYFVVNGYFIFVLQMK